MAPKWTQYEALVELFSFNQCCQFYSERKWSSKATVLSSVLLPCFTCLTCFTWLTCLTSVTCCCLTCCCLTCCCFTCQNSKYSKFLISHPMITTVMLFECLSGEEPWSSGKGRWLVIKRSWVQTQAPFTGWMYAMLAITYKQWK
jgi:hypothetical protein